jgi:hypothetical protein
MAPIYRVKKVKGGKALGNSPQSYAKASGGIVTTDTPTLVEHEFNIAGVSNFLLLNAGTLDVAYTITGSASFGGFSTSGTMSVTTYEVVSVLSGGSVVVSYNPTTDWTPA